MEFLQWLVQYLNGSFLEKNFNESVIVNLDLVDEGHFAIDAGANVGKVTFFFAMRGSIVFAFEPHPDAYRLLEKRFGHWENVHLYNSAICDFDGKIKLFLHQKNDENPISFSTGSSLLASKTNVNSEKFVWVDAIDLSTFIKSSGQCFSILKMDIEGAEVDVLPKIITSGAIDKVKKILVETHEEKNAFLSEKTKRLKELLYKQKLNEKVSLDWH